MLGLEKDELGKISKGDEMMEKFKDNVEDLNLKNDMIFLLTLEEDAIKTEKTLISEAKAKGEKKDYKQAKKKV